MKDQTKIEIDPGDSCRDYQAGNYVNAIDEITCYFQEGNGGDITNEEIADALEMYARHIRNGI